MNSVLVVAAGAGTVVRFDTQDAAALSFAAATVRLRAAAAVENSAVTAYGLVTKLPAVSAGAGTTVIKQMAIRLQSNRRQAAKILNAAAVKLGDNEQLAGDGSVDRSTGASLHGAKGVADVLGALAALERTAAATCASFASDTGDQSATRALMAIGPTHARDAAVLTTLREIALKDPGYLEIRPAFAQLPTTAGTAGAPASLIDLGPARPAR